MKRTNISVFIPHIGCPHRCSFCGQLSISGAAHAPSPEEDAALLRALYLQTPPLTLRAYSEKTGIPVMTLHYRKEKLLRLLKQQI